MKRWLDLQNAATATRFRYADTSAGIVTTKQLQYRGILRGRLKFDTAGRYALNFGAVTGTRFTGSWDNTPWGINGAQTNVAVRALYLSAQPIRGVDAEAGGLYILKGESTEITTYDDDGYVTGERLRLRRPAQFFFDEISVTNGYFTGTPSSLSVSSRLRHIGTSNYQQFLLNKKIVRRAAVSGDYTIETGRRTWHEALSLDVRGSRILDSVIFDNYQRTNATAAAGFALTVEKALTRKLTVNGGYARVDPKFGGLNADRFNLGRRVFTTTSYALTRDLVAAFFITTTVGDNGVLPQRVLSNASLTYNLLPALKRTGLF